MTQLQIDKNIERYLRAVESGLAIDDARALEKLHHQASTLLTHIEEASSHLHEDDREEATLLKAAVDELKVQAALGRMEGSEKIDAIGDRIKSGLQHVKTGINNAKQLTVEEKNTIKDNLHEGWRHLDLEVTLLYLRLSAAYDAGSEKLSAARDEVAGDLRTIRDSAREHSDEVTHKFTNWIKRVEKKVSRRGHRILQTMDDYFEKW